MTGRTHDLAAFTTLTLLIAVQPLTTLSLGTVITAVSASMLGALTPDLDQPTAHFWHDLPAGSIIGSLVHPLLGGHRLISHSLLGLFLVGWGLKYLLAYIHTFLLVDMYIVWWVFILGYLSHLVMDTLTKEGVPWLFPLPVRFGFPPFEFLRVTTGKLIEKVVVFPGLLFLNGLIIYQHYSKFISFFTHHVVK